jgi:hypothetical protein
MDFVKSSLWISDPLRSTSISIVPKPRYSPPQSNQPWKDFPQTSFNTPAIIWFMSTCMLLEQNIKTHITNTNITSAITLEFWWTNSKVFQELTAI